jgi:hypothetical protein
LKLPAAALFALCALASFGQADGATGARVSVEPAAFDFGNVRGERTLQKEITVRNVGDGELEIRKVSTTCGCAVVGAFQKRVAQGDSTTLRIAFTTPAAAGRTQQTLTIETNDKEHPRVEVKVSATVVAARKTR